MARRDKYLIGDLAYLEATSATSRKFYKRFGFSVLGKVQGFDRVLEYALESRQLVQELK